VAAGYVLGSLPELVRGGLHPERSLVLVSSSWHAVGPAVVVGLFADPTPNLGDWPVYLGALAAQFAFDFVSSTGRERIAFGTDPAALVPVLAWVYAVDVLLAPVGLLAALGEPYAFVLILPLGLLLLLLARERQARLDRAITFSQAYEVASHEARRDALTGLGNRLAWENALVAVSGRRAGVLILDLDGLKAANDTRGHEFGDELLRTVAAVVRGCVRDHDLLARIGGDELAVLMPEAEEQACSDAEERIAAALEAHPGLDGFALSASFGSATTPPAETVFEAYRLADRRMYAMKTQRDSRRPTVSVSAYT
jgi:diguanylate cyclase (GGDEF)-like protein